MAKKSGRYELYLECIKPHLAEIEEMVSKGYRETAIARHFGVGPTSFNKYKNKYPELRMAIHRGRSKVEQLVIAALLERALGGYKEETKMTPKGLEVNKKYYPPDVNAIRMILRNFKTENWVEMSDEEREYRERELKIKEKLADEKCFSDGGDLDE